MTLRKAAVVGAFAIGLAGWVLAAVSYRSYRLARDSRDRAQAALQDRKVAAGTLAIVNCFEPLQSARLRTGGNAASGPGEVIVTCSRELRADGVHFFIEVGNPFSVTYDFVSFTTELNVMGAWQPLHSDPTKPSVDIIESLKPGQWARFELRPPEYKRWPLPASDFDAGFARLFTGLEAVRISAYTRGVDLPRPSSSIALP